MLTRSPVIDVVRQRRQRSTVYTLPLSFRAFHAALKASSSTQRDLGNRRTS
jgi:hypothetical protein